MDYFKAIDKSAIAKWVVLSEIQPILQWPIFDAFKQAHGYLCVRKVSF